MVFDEALHDLCQAHHVAVVYLYDAQPRAGAGERESRQVGFVSAEPGAPGARPAMDLTLLRDFRNVFDAPGLEVDDLQQAGPLLQYRGITGQLIYSMDEARRSEFEERVVRDYLDFAFEMRLYDEEKAEEMDRESSQG